MARPDWIWLPNELVTGAAGESPPVELVRQTQDVMMLRLLVDFYHAQNLRDDGGVSRKLTWQEYERFDSKPGSTTRDVIKDFDHLVDKIDLMGIDADTTVAGNQAFHWVGTAALTAPGEVGYFTSSGNTIIRASNDGDVASEFEIQLTGLKTLAALDFHM